MIYFIVNPIAGGGRAFSLINEIKSSVTGKFHILVTDAPMDGNRLAKQAVHEGAQAVVAVGGDGTVQEVVSGIAGSGCAFGVIPCGSGNDFIKSIDISEKLPTSGYLDIIRCGNIRKIDLIKMNDFYFANIASLGVDAQIVHIAQRLKKKLRGFSYVAAALYCTMTCGPTYMSIIADGVRYDREFTLAAICNGWNYGGGFKIAPCAKNDDGLITLCLIDKMSKPAMTVLLPSLMLAKHMSLKEVHFINCKNIEINFEGIQLVNLDGNLYKLSGPLEFEIVPASLKVLSTKPRY